MSYQGQDPNQQGQYTNQGYGGYTPPQPQPTDPYSGQQYGQPGGYQQPFGAPGASTTSIGLTQNTAAGLSYLFTWVSGLIIFLTEKQNRFVRFHAMQSILFFGGLTVLNVLIGVIGAIGIPFIGFLGWIVWPVWLVGWIVLMINGFQGNYFKLPIVGDYAEKYVDQIKV